MPKELTQDWLDWIFENIQRGCDRKELLDILLKEGFDPQLCKIALGYELSKNEIKEYLALHKDDFYDEFVEGNFIQSDKVDVPSRLFELSDELKNKIHNSLQKPMEAWSKTKLEPTFVYGIRDYKKGAVLIPHRDRNETHIINAIINIDKKVEKDWPLEIDDHFYRRHEVFLEPGEVLFYESARLLHGRPTPLKGESYSNIFCHYMPKH